MARPVTLFTGQWADLPLAELAPLARSMGYDGLELACWGDHFNVQQALASDTYVRDKWALLKAHGLQCFAIGNHLVGQAVCDLIDERHQSILPPHVWGDGVPEGVRQRAAAELADTARAAAAFERMLAAKPMHTTTTTQWKPRMTNQRRTSMPMKQPMTTTTTPAAVTPNRNHTTLAAPRRISPPSR